MTLARRRWRKRGIIAFGVGFLLWLVSSYFVAYRLTHRWQPVTPEPLPVVAWGTPQSIRIETTDCQDLGGWFVPGNSDRSVVILLHGNGGNRTSCLPEAELLATHGFPVLLLTLRAHGDSTGDVNDFGYSARHDVIAAVDWLETKHLGRPVVWGKSLGSAAAIFAAAELGSRVRGYILECPFQDLPTAVSNRTRLLLPPVLDVVAYAGLRITAPLVLPDTDRISPLAAASSVPRDTPVLVLAGDADRRARPEEAQAIVERLGPRAELLVFPGGDHLALARTDPKRYRTAVLDFLRKIQADGP